MTWRPYGELTPLLKAFRSTNSPANMLALECFLLVAEEPRTMGYGTGSLRGWAVGLLGLAVRRRGGRKGRWAEKGLYQSESFL